MATLETVRLRLEPLSAAHADALYAIYCQDGVRRFLITRPNTRPDFDRVFERALRFEVSHGMWAIVDKATSAFIGRVGFFAFAEAGRPELAFLLSESNWGMGLATEASLACLHHAFERRAWQEVIAVARPGNAAAIRVLTKLRMRAEQTLALGGEPAIVYQVSRDAFEERVA